MYIYIHMCIGVIGAANVFRVMSCVCPALALHMSNELLSKIRTDQVRNNRPQTIVMYGFLPLNPRRIGERVGAHAQSKCQMCFWQGPGHFVANLKTQIILIVFVSGMSWMREVTHELSILNSDLSALYPHARCNYRCGRLRRSVFLLDQVFCQFLISFEVSVHSLSGFL